VALTALLLAVSVFAIAAVFDRSIEEVFEPPTGGP